MMRWAVLGLLLWIGSFSQQTLAKKAKRKGFNFGTTIRLVDLDQPSTLLNNEGRNMRSKSDFRSIKPHVGYAIGNVINLGISGIIEDSSNETVLDGMSKGEKIRSQKSSKLAGGNLFARLLFGNIMYLETGAGYFERNTTVDTEYTTEAGTNEFTGRREAIKRRLAGLGYHFGAGIEFPLSYGFFFTTNYKLNLFNFRPFRSPGSKSQNYKEKGSEVSFGVSNYFN